MRTPFASFKVLVTKSEKAFADGVTYCARVQFQFQLLSFFTHIPTSVPTYPKNRLHSHVLVEMRIA